MAMGTGLSIGFDICIGMAIDIDISIDMKTKRLLQKKKPRILSHASSKYKHKVKMKSRFIKKSYTRHHQKIFFFKVSYFTLIFVEIV